MASVVAVVALISTGVAMAVNMGAILMVNKIRMQANKSLRQLLSTNSVGPMLLLLVAGLGAYAAPLELLVKLFCNVAMIVIMMIVIMMVTMKTTMMININ